MAFWQEWFLDRCAGKAVPSPASASLGWPKVNTQTGRRRVQNVSTTEEDSGAFGWMPVDSCGRGNSLRLSAFAPEVARHHQLENTR
jgi:hypothetical protein